MNIEVINRPPPLPKRPKDGHKGIFGRVLIVGGSDGMPGAPVLAGNTALRAGSGLVQIAAPREILHFCLTMGMELIGLGLDDDNLDALIDAADKADALVVGPGIGTTPAARQRVLRLAGLDKPMVIDADALNLLAAETSWPADLSRRAILTPHPGEMQRLARHLGHANLPDDDAGRLALAEKASLTFGCIVLLKGHRTVITDGERAYLNRTGDSSLSKAGSGDVLSGLIGSLLGQGIAPFDAACLGAWIHGKAGERLGKRIGRRSVMAHEMFDSVAEVMKKLDQRGDQ